MLSSSLENRTAAHLHLMERPRHNLTLGGVNEVRIVHRIAGDSSERVWTLIGLAGISVSTTAGISVARVPEDHPSWPEIEARLGRALHTIENVFSAPELASAEWLLIHAKGHHGYPQPENGWESHVYSRGAYCRTCGIGGEQQAPFRFRKEPGVARSHFIQLNWVFDAFFVRAVVRDGMLAAGITGIEFAPPVIHRSGLPIQGVEQMRISTNLAGGLDVSALQTVWCKERTEESQLSREHSRALPTSPNYCGRVKYHWTHRGPLQFSRSALDGAPDVVKSAEWFGSGGSAARAVLVSQRFRTLVEQSGWRGLGFEPVSLA